MAGLSWVGYFSTPSAVCYTEVPQYLTPTVICSLKQAANKARVRAKRSCHYVQTHARLTRSAKPLFYKEASSAVEIVFYSEIFLKNFKLYSDIKEVQM